MHYRRYATETDRANLWRLKRSFERELAAATGGEAKRGAYEAKLTDAYRDRFLAWVDRCVTESGDCVTVASASADELYGYAFVLPESLALVWDAAVLNELYVSPEYRGTGVADELLDAAVDVARQQDLPLDRMVLDVAPANGRALAFYDRHDFEPWGELIARTL